MKRLFEIEWIKLRHSKSGKVISTIYVAITILTLIICWKSNAGEFINSLNILEEIREPFKFPGIWLTGTWLSAWLIIFPVMISVLNVGGDFTQKMHRQHIIDGLTRKEYVLSKLVSVFIISVLFTLYTFFLCVLAGILIGKGEVSIYAEANNFALYLFGYFIYTFNILSFAMLITFFVKRAGLSIFTFIGYYFVLENLIWYFAKYTAIPKYLPLKSVSNNIFPNFSGTAARISSEFGETPTMLEYEEYTSKLWNNWVMFDWNAILIAIVYIGIYFLISRWLFLKRDL